MKAGSVPFPSLPALPVQFAASSFRLFRVACGSRQCLHFRPGMGALRAIRRLLVSPTRGCPRKPAVSPFPFRPGRPVQFAASSFHLCGVAHESRQCLHSRPGRDAPCSSPPPRSAYWGFPVEAGSVPIPVSARTPRAIRRLLVPPTRGFSWKLAVCPFPSRPERPVQFAAFSFRLVWVARVSRQWPHSGARRNASCNSLSPRCG